MYTACIGVSNKLEICFPYSLIYQKELVIFVQQYQKTAKKIVYDASFNLLLSATL